MTDFLELVKNEFCNLPLTEHQARQFAAYGKFLTEYNEKVNLTAVKDPEAIVRLHFLDSAEGAFLPEVGEGARCADVGTGAGFPGVPVAILRPDVHITLIDSLQKRLVFLEQLKDMLGLANVETLHGRSEDIGHMPEYRERFDCVFSRAVARLNVLCELDMPLVRKGGCMIAWKGPAAKEEIPEAKHALGILGGTLERSIDCREEENAHLLLIIRKTAPTPAKYPRQAGTPKNKPL